MRIQYGVFERQLSQPRVFNPFLEQVLFITRKRLQTRSDRFTFGRPQKPSADWNLLGTVTESRKREWISRRRCFASFSPERGRRDRRRGRRRRQRRRPSGFIFLTPMIVLGEMAARRDGTKATERRHVLSEATPKESVTNLFLSTEMKP